MNANLTAKLTALTALLAVAAAIATPALAQEATPDGFDAVHATASRDAVRAEAADALRAGTIERGEASVDRAVHVSFKSRAQVAAEAREALRLGVVGYGEGPSPRVTTAQADAIRGAGLQAVSTTMAAR